MSDATSQAQVDAANAYEALFVPALFGPWAAKVADAARIRPGDRVLDVACGTGVLAREAAARVGANGRVAGIDPALGMLAVARNLSPTIEWHEGSAEALPFPDHSFDATVSQFGLMFFADRLRAIREMWRILAPGGRLAMAVWDSLEKIPAYAAEVDLLERTAGRPAADALRAPFVLGDRGELARLFEDAGVGSAEITTLVGTAVFPTVRVMVEADLRGWLPVMGVHLAEHEIASTLQQGERDLERFVAPDGKIVFTTSAHLVSATRPW